MVIDAYLRSYRAPGSLVPDPVSKEEVSLFAEAARWAPSAQNEQVWRFLIISSDKKDAVIQAIESQDPRLQISDAVEAQPPSSQYLDKMSFTFTQEYYNSNQDPFREMLTQEHGADLECVQNASVSVVCTYPRTLIGKFWGGLEIGGAILQLLLKAEKHGLSVRWIRNFDRVKIRTAYRIPYKFEIPAVLAIGAPNEGYEKQRSVWNAETERARSGISLEDLILDRRSVRDYRREAIPQDVIESLQDLGNLIPTFVPKKFIDIIPIVEQNLLQKVAREARIVFVKQKHVAIAPAVFAITYSPTGAAGFFGQPDTGMAIESILLEAYAAGIGTCWIGAFRRGQIRQLLGIPETHRVEALITLGYPAKYPKPPPRLPLGEITYMDSWQVPFLSSSNGGRGQRGVASILLRNLKSTDTATILRDRDAGTPWVPRFQELYEGQDLTNKEE